MAPRDDIEFVADEGPSAAPEAVLAPGPHRRSRWLIVLVGLAVLATAATVIARNSEHPSAASHPTAVPSVSVSGSGVVSRKPPPPIGFAPGIGTPLIRGNHPALDVALGGARVWTVLGHRLYGFGGGRILQVPLPRLDLSAPDAFLRILPDGPRGLWLVTCGTRTARILEYDTTTRQAVRDVRWRRVVQDAVALAGRLYLSTDRGVAELGPRGGFRGAPRLVPGLYGAVGPIAADPVRHRLIALDRGAPIEFWTYRPGSKPVEVSSRISTDLRGIAVTRRGAIWLGGFTHDGGQLLRLDPRTLRPVRRVLPDEDFGPGAIVLAGGDRVVWVRAGDGTDRLACVDAASGRVEQSWPGAPGRVASRHGAGYLAGTGGLAPLHLRDCAG